MPRLQLVEIEDLPICPASVRDPATGVLMRGLGFAGWPGAIARRLEPWLTELGWPEIFDCCSGAAGPWPGILRTLPVRVTFSDRYPNRQTWESIAAQFPDRVKWVDGPVDARCPPPNFGGVWTFCNSFHHMDRAAARKIVGEAVYRGRPLAIFEALEKRWLSLLMVLYMPIFALLTGWLNPRAWLFTYLIPLIPLLLLFDGLVSAFRIYGPEDWREILAESDPDGLFEWEVGRLKLGWVPAHFTYVLGRPRL